jgi:thiamine biosynthesis lipoprotein
MSKTSTESTRHALHGPTMGTRWSALFHAPPTLDVAPVQAALQKAVDAVNNQMSTWLPDSDLIRLNRAPVGTSTIVPADLARVLSLGLAIGRASGGAFHIGMGDAVQAWGFGPQTADPGRIRCAMQAARPPAHESIEIFDSLVHKLGDITLDLNGIAKGYAVDRLAETLRTFDIRAGLVGIDGELRAVGLRPDGEAWTVAIEAPEHDRRTPHSILSLQDAAVATSGDYRHWVSVGGHRLSHTMDPRRGAPLSSSPASVTVVAPTCAEADAWATALMVTGIDAGLALASRHSLSALFLAREADGNVLSRGCGPLFAA